ncbi:ABC transporter permease [Galactobacter valiniphilus]|uniref:ABC transporter permease n=1 Tax=Galactobacter valiniphilus TaxID=2676122 RepID=A0A399J6M4_9MICC|nr:ABC transporter permease [Galactobacter valiniphilus]RII41118.1 ABC transporter permease [Galactobacter valiniphilus]
MFLARRDLVFAKGRFALIASVVALITVLVGFLTGLTAGLAGQNVDAVLSWKADRLVVSAPQTGAQESFATSALTEQQVEAWRSAAPDAEVRPIGLSQLSASHGELRAGIALVAGAPGAGTGPGAGDTPAPAPGETVLSQDAASALHAAAGDTITVAGQELRVTAVAGTGHYSHVPLVSVAPESWHAAALRTGAEPATVATVLAITGQVNDDAAAAAERGSDTVSLSGFQALSAVGSFRSEIGSLGLMIALLLGISALVVGAFFTVWTLQRKGDLAVLKALGAPTGALVRDALAQAGIVLLIGIAVGLGLVVAAGSALPDGLPFVLSPLTTVLPGVVMALLGLGGAAVALRSVTHADPQTALGSAR